MMYKNGRSLFWDAYKTLSAKRALWNVKPGGT
jgi:hypothetical protein